MKEKYSNLFAPFSIGNCEIKNKFTMAPMGPAGLCEKDGAFNQKAIDYYVERAKGGTGLIMTGICYVENEIEKCAMPSMPCPTLNPANFIKTGRIMTERVHAYDSKIFLQLTAGFGRVALPIVLEGEAVAPSPIENKWDPRIKCRELTTKEVEAYVKKFAEASMVAKMAGFDGVEIHAVHEGYLLDQFAISLFNNRTDKYGGDLKGRLRFTTEIVEAIKNTCGEDFPVSLRYSVKSYIKGINQGGLPDEDFKELGRDLDEGLEAAKILEEAGYDAFNADAGTYDSWYWNHPPMYFEKGMYLHLTEELKKVVNVPVLAAGRMENPDLASRAIEEGKTDALSLGRALLADPYVPKKIRQNNLEDIRPCLSCHDGCMGRIGEGGNLSCAVNPSAGREKVYGIEPAINKKKVMIIGGGLAGMEAARVCAIKGHNVNIYEKGYKLGGNIIPGGVPDFKEDDRALVKWYEKQLTDLDIEINLNAKVNKDIVLNENPDTVIVATGSTPIILDIPGINDNNVLTASDVLLDEDKAGDEIIVIGAGLVGCETALWLRQKGKKVTVIEASSEILGGPHSMPFMNYDMLKDLLNYDGVDIKTNTTVKSINNEGVLIETKEGEISLKADTVVMAVGYKPQRELYKELEKEIGDVYLLGDARKVKNIMHAIWDSYEVARGI